MPEAPIIRGQRDHDLADAIGSLFMNFALLNSYINGAVSAQLRLSLEQARALVLPLQPRQKMDLLLWYAEHHWSKAAVKEVRELCGRARAVTDYRNHIAHGDLVLNDPDGDVHLVVYNSGHRFDPKPRPLKPKDVAHNSIVALSIAQEFRELGQRIAAGAIERKDGPPPK